MEEWRNGPTDLDSDITSEEELVSEEELRSPKSG
jgi:hypothetical protein